MKPIYELRHFLDQKRAIGMNRVSCENGVSRTGYPSLHVGQYRLCDIFTGIRGNKTAFRQSGLVENVLNSMTRGSHSTRYSHSHVVSYTIRPFYIVHLRNSKPTTVNVTNAHRSRISLSVRITYSTPSKLTSAAKTLLYAFRGGLAFVYDFEIAIGYKHLDANKMQDMHFA